MIHKYRFALAGMILGLLIAGFISVKLLPRYERYLSSAINNKPYHTIEPSSSPTPSPTPDPFRPRTFLLLGYVGGNHEGGLLTDTMILSQLNFKNKQLTLISIPRDLWVTIPLKTNLESTTAGKINQLYALGTDQRRKIDLPTKYQVKTGGLLLAQDVVSDIIQHPIEDVFAINQAGLIAALTKLGPIPVKVPYSFTDDFFPIAGEENNTCAKTPEEVASLSASLHGFELEKQFTCRFEQLAFSAGLQELDASTAAKFVRSRHANIGGSDFGRSQRQQALIVGIKTLLSQPSNWLKLPTLVSNIFKNVESTLELKDFLELISLTSNPETWQIKSYQIDEKNALWQTRSSDGQYILVDRTASGSTQLNNQSWKMLSNIVNDWLTQTPAEESSRGGSLDVQAP